MQMVHATLTSVKVNHNHSHLFARAYVHFIFNSVRIKASLSSFQSDASPCLASLTTEKHSYQTGITSMYDGSCGIEKSFISENSSGAVNIDMNQKMSRNLDVLETYLGTFWIRVAELSTTILQRQAPSVSTYTVP